MPTSREVMQMALDALVLNHDWHIRYDDYNSYEDSELWEANAGAIEILRAELAKPEPEPEPFGFTDPDGHGYFQPATGTDSSDVFACVNAGWVPLYRKEDL